MYWLQSHSVGVQAISAVVSAFAALSIAVLTFFLVRATNRYVAETAKYVRLVQEQLNLLRAQLAAPLLLDVWFFNGASPQLTLKCRHSGGPSSLPAILKHAVLQFYPLEGPTEAEVSDEVSLNQILSPGKTWSRSLTGKVAAKISRLPSPNPWHALFRGGPRLRAAGRLSVTLRFQRSGQAESEKASAEYEVRTHFLRGTTLAAS